MPSKEERQTKRTDKHGRSQLIEYRGAEARAAGDSDSVAGYLSAFWVVDSYGTAFAPSAFDKTIRERGDRLPLLYQHNPDWAVGRLANLVVDETGLHHDSGIVDDGAEGTVLRKRLAFGVPFAHSHGFQTLRERPANDSDPLIILPDTAEWIVRNLPHSVYVIEEVRLWEGSVATFPANELAVIESARADARMQALAQTLEDLRAGSLDAPGRALVAELAAALASAAPAGPAPAPRTDAEARKDREHALMSLAAARGLTLEQITCAA